MSLEQLSLVNFQTHRKLVVELDPHVTVFIGRSDVGKSAILRALRWLCTNKPSGLAFRRDGAAYVKVTLRADGKQISRKNGTGNLYRLESKQFRAFGTSVPTEIQKLLNISEVNFQGQHLAPFWFSDSPGQVSKALNQIVNLGDIDKTLSNLSSELKKSKLLVETSAERLQAAKEEKKSLQWVSEYDRRLQGLERTYQRIKKKRLAVVSVASLLDKIAKTQRTVETAGRAAVIGEELVSKGLRVKRQQSKVQALQTILSSIETEESRTCRLKKELKLVQEELRKQSHCPLCESPLTKS